MPNHSRPSVIDASWARAQLVVRSLQAASVCVGLYLLLAAASVQNPWIQPSRDSSDTGILVTSRPRDGFLPTASGIEPTSINTDRHIQGGWEGARLGPLGGCDGVLERGTSSANVRYDERMRPNPGTNCSPAPPDTKSKYERDTRFGLLSPAHLDWFDYIVKLPVVGRILAGIYSPLASAGVAKFRGEVIEGLGQ
ncbi:hypothetical protein BD779DRAFT_1788909 [Infundibulicybe gibba]|nr:hypothetical protein BD779DRAFT_1788909 [Infundibulicybe gibba]